ncbi:Hypothetical protein ORPV_1183 [Orpheovirus IHUMI-LCC2]|uniref:Uncharacterized protein n=1 Tax=Orpheovirus IHUMI-LCC2 TaxID=2023057 RepID=A0A2I2L6D2_9VIRU|nr:Hypothetical protein ORPV_1183 [Orpheovirus IHUMI-LCC2]SNW63087.1 Hypothetical protein ORPV_1183 [Orpheovirus IHUMI-LCC2]
MYNIIKMVDIQDIVLGIVSIILIIIIIIYIIVQSNRGSGANLSRCPIGQCATNRTTGVKTCPSTDDEVINGIQYDILTDVCNSPNICDSISTPNAVLKDGETNTAGICDVDRCRCISINQCENGLVVLFRSLFDNPEGGSITNQRTGFIQQSYYDNFYQETVPNTEIRITGENIPIQYTNGSGDLYCTLRLEWLSRTIPVNCDLSGLQTNTFETIERCLNTRPICQTGTLAYISAEGQTDITINRLIGGRYGCVEGTIGTCNGSIPVYDQVNNKIICRRI